MTERQEKFLRDEKGKYKSFDSRRSNKLGITGIHLRIVTGKNNKKYYYVVNNEYGNSSRVSKQHAKDVYGVS